MYFLVLYIATGKEKGISKIVFVLALLGELLLLVFIFVCLLWKFDFLSQIRNSICKSDKRGKKDYILLTLDVK